MIKNKRVQELNELCTKLNVSFNDMYLLHLALTHTSYANEAKGASQHNERLEFLGDAVLDLVISEFLYCRYPNLCEGELTKARAMIVCEPTLARCATKLGIGQYLLLGKGEATSGGRSRFSILADAFEAIIGAIYLDRGFDSAVSFIHFAFDNELNALENGQYNRDYKTLLQEVVQRNNEGKVAYEILQESGPDHDKTFDVAVLVNSSLLGTGSGKSKKEAEQLAAKQALLKMNIIRDN